MWERLWCFFLSAMAACSAVEIGSQSQSVLAYDCVTDQSQIEAADCQALVSLYESTDGDNWTNNAGWGTGNPGDWQGVIVSCATCSGGYSLMVYLGNNNLNGQLPSEFADMSEHRSYWSLGDNYLSGPLPDFAGARIFRAPNNQLSGSLPSLPSILAQLDLRNNSLAGTIESFPVAFDEVYLDDNSFTGTIPSLHSSPYGRATFNNNLFTRLPVEYSAGLVELGARNNQISSPIPDAIGTAASLQFLDLAGNRIPGSVPETMGDLFELWEVDMSDNELVGTVPVNLGLLPVLRHLNLSDNHLSGEVPRTLSALGSLDTLQLHNNHFEGDISHIFGLGLYEISTFTLRGNFCLTSSVSARQQILKFGICPNDPDPPECDLSVEDCEFICTFGPWLNYHDPLWGDGCTDSDQDGLVDRKETFYGTDPQDADSDDDGIADGDELDWNLDTDEDGRINARDADADNDGLSDGLELGLQQPDPDTDIAAGLFVADLDPSTFTDPLVFDTDGGGVSDGEEDLNKNGRVDVWETDPLQDGDDDAVNDADKDKLSNSLEMQIGSDPLDADSDDDGVIDGDELEPTADTDTDGIINVLDPDSDDDGLFDGTELGVWIAHGDTDTAAGYFIPDGDPSSTTNPLLVDTDGGGLPDGVEDCNGDGEVDDSPGVCIWDPSAAELDPTEAADDDFVLLVDSDGDSITDLQEGAGDFDDDGIVNKLDLDSDGDGILDSVEAGDFDYHSPPRDTDLSGQPDFLDIDSDDDGILDAEESANDFDGDGIPNFQDLDSDGDSIADAIEGRRPESVVFPADTDVDGVPDYLDLDSDGDLILDVEEAFLDGSALPLDYDRDGIFNFQDLDSDGDGLNDNEEAGDAALGTPARDTDGDGNPDFVDTDSDGDESLDYEDNCVLINNQDQQDSDGDGIGDACSTAGPADSPAPGCSRSTNGYLYFSLLILFWMVSTVLPADNHRRKSSEKIWE